MISTIATIAAPFIGAATAIWIATRVYVHQKRIDARNLLAVDKKAAFTAYFEAAADLHTELRAALYRGDDQEAHLSMAESKLHLLYRTQDALALNAGSDALQVCREYTISLLGLRAHTRHFLKSIPMGSKYQVVAGPYEAIQCVLDCRATALILARSEILGVSEIESKEALAGLLERKDILEELGFVGIEPAIDCPNVS